jgi:hypothetical protein
MDKPTSLIEYTIFRGDNYRLFRGIDRFYYDRVVSNIKESFGTIDKRMRFERECIREVRLMSIRLIIEYKNYKIGEIKEIKPQEIVHDFSYIIDNYDGNPKYNKIMQGMKYTGLSKTYITKVNKVKLCIIKPHVNGGSGTTPIETESDITPLAVEENINKEMVYVCFTVKYNTQTFYMHMIINVEPKTLLLKYSNEEYSGIAGGIQKRCGAEYYIASSVKDVVELLKKEGLDLVNEQDFQPTTTSGVLTKTHSAIPMSPPIGGHTRKRRHRINRTERRLPLLPRKKRMTRIKRKHVASHKRRHI